MRNVGRHMNVTYKKRCKLRLVLGMFTLSESECHRISSLLMLIFLFFKGVFTRNDIQSIKIGCMEANDDVHT